MLYTLLSGISVHLKTILTYMGSIQPSHNYCTKCFCTHVYYSPIVEWTWAMQSKWTWARFDTRAQGFKSWISRYAWWI